MAFGSYPQTLPLVLASRTGVIFFIKNGIGVLLAYTIYADSRPTRNFSNIVDSKAQRNFRSCSGLLNPILDMTTVSVGQLEILATPIVRQVLWLVAFSERHWSIERISEPRQCQLAVTCKSSPNIRADGEPNRPGQLLQHDHSHSLLGNGWSRDTMRQEMFRVGWEADT